VGGQRRGKGGGRVTPKGGATVSSIRSHPRGVLEDLFARVLRLATGDLGDDLPALEAEMWASHLWSMLHEPELVDEDPTAQFVGGFITYAAQRATPTALAALRAMAAVLPAPFGAQARREAGRLASAGVAERRWAPLVGTGSPTTAGYYFDPIDDDGVTVIVEFDGPEAPSTVGVYVDHNLGGMAKDALVLPISIPELLATMRDSEEFANLEYREISLGEARSRWKASLELTDMTIDAPSSEDLEHARALVANRLARLPSGAKMPKTTEMSEAAQDTLISEFLGSPEIEGITGSRRVEDAVWHLANQILYFSRDYVRGTPLRFSPVMVEIFCLDWAPRKIAIDEDGFNLLADVLAAWIRFVGRRRAIPAESIDVAVQAAYEYAPEMIELSQDPASWGPGKTMSLAMTERGIDVTDQAALDRFVDEVNRGGGIDQLAASLARAKPRRR
jgi:hypothetical protein